MVSTPRGDFLNALGLFSLALDGAFGDEGRALSSSLDSMASAVRLESPRSAATVWASSAPTTTTMGGADIFVANDTTPNFLYHNERNGTFEEVALPSGVAVAADGRPRAGMGTDFSDYDGDGDLDLFVTNHEMEAHTLFRNLGKGLFEDATFTSGVGPPTLPFVGFGVGFVDVDNDSDLDVAIVNGHVMNSASHFRPGTKEARRNLLVACAVFSPTTSVDSTMAPGTTPCKSSPAGPQRALSWHP